MLSALRLGRSGIAGCVCSSGMRSCMEGFGGEMAASAASSEMS